MKKLMLLSVLCLMTMVSFAQKNADAAVAELSTKVELTSDQEAQILQIEKTFASDFKEIGQLKASDPAHYLQKLSVMKEMKMGKVKELLTDAQMDNYISFRKAKAKIRTADYKKWQEEDLPELEIRIRMMEAM